jgi:hypothetical protein
VAAFGINYDFVEMENLGVRVHRLVIHIVAKLTFQPRVMAVIFSVFINGGSDVANSVAVIAGRVSDI